MTDRILPTPMRKAPRWFPVHVKLDKSTGKWTKKPAVEWSNPANWKTYAELEKAPALGFALGDGFFGIDLDNCLDESGAVTPERKQLVNDVLDLCPSFTEVSWSGKGLHVYGYAKMPSACKDATPGLEMYSDKRFFLVTGRPFDANNLLPLKDVQGGIEALYRKYARKPERIAKPADNTVGEGHRSNTIFSRASTLYKLGYSQESVVAAMLAWNREHCNPPLPEEMVAKQCENRYPDEKFPEPAKRYDLQTAGETADEAYQDLIARAEGRSAQVPTCIELFDSYIGGLPPGSQTTIGGPSSTGKTMLMLMMALAQSREGFRVGFISVEDPPTVIGARLIADRSGVSSSRINRGRLTPDETVRAREAVGYAHGLPMGFAYAIGRPPEDILDAAQTFIGDGCRVIYVDYLQAIAGDPRAPRYDKVVADAAKQLKGLCYRKKVPLVLGSQLHRYGNMFSEPSMYSMKESGDIENSSEVILLLWRESDQLDARVFGKIAKLKWGPAGLRFELIRDPDTGVATRISEGIYKTNEMEVNTHEAARRAEL